MIQHHYGDPSLGAIRQPGKLRAISEFNQSKQAVRILDYVDRFITYYEQAKGQKPEVIHLRPSQLKALGVKPGKRRNGVRLEVMA